MYYCVLQNCRGKLVNISLHVTVFMSLCLCRYVRVTVFMLLCSCYCVHVAVVFICYLTASSALQ